MNIKLSKEKLECLFVDYKTTQIKELSKKYKISIATIQNYIRLYGVRRERLNKKVCKNKFLDLKNNEVNYWLGFLATDGAIHKDRVALSQKLLDKDVIEKFNIFLGINQELKVRFHKKETGNFPYVGTSFRNKEIVKYLNLLGITTVKSFTLNMNFPITFDFLRGVVDGDGSISVKNNNNNNTRNRIRLSTMSTFFINQISSFLNEQNINHKIYQNKKGLYDLHVHRNKDLLKLINNLYYDNCVSMSRKHNNADQIRNNLNKISETQGTIVKNPEASLQLN